MNSQASNVYIPRNIVGINARSGQIGDAQDFIRAFLSKENQLMSTEGFPVNRAAFDQACDKEENQSGDADPVSYTHLDVYKRQSIYCAYSAAG